jgi:hypothetical protein
MQNATRNGLTLTTKADSTDIQGTYLRQQNSGLKITTDTIPPISDFNDGKMALQSTRMKKALHTCGEITMQKMEGNFTVVLKGLLGLCCCEKSCSVSSLYG